MAWPASNFAAISDADLAYLAADKPILGSQAIPVAPTVVWHNSGSTTDRTDSTYPARRGYDGLTGLVTKPTTVNPDTTWYYYINDLAGAMSFDFLALIGHNLGALHANGALTVTLELDETSAFDASTISIPITVTASASNVRLMVLSLKHTGSDPLLYSSIQFARLKITRGATNFTPEIGELILGKRLQMYHKPNTPYDPTARSGISERSKTMGGVVHKSTFSKYCRTLSAEWTEDNTTLHSAIEAFVYATGDFSRNFVWIENPYSAPASWALIDSEDVGYSFPIEEASIRTFAIVGDEQGPESHYLRTGTY